jgi:hypothetical protein
MFKFLEVFLELNNLVSVYNGLIREIKALVGELGKLFSGFKQSHFMPPSY